MPLSEQQFFDDLARRLEILNADPDRDGEASRHDQLILPLLTNPNGLGWLPEDLISQHQVIVPSAVEESHLFRGAVPKNRKPDLLISPHEVSVPMVVIEEKKRQEDIAALHEHRLQVREYQGLYGCVWGLLSDGEKWIVYRNFETHHTFDSLRSLQLGLGDLRHCVGKDQILDRWNEHKTCDLVYLVSSPSPEPQPSNPYGSADTSSLGNVAESDAKPRKPINLQEIFDAMNPAVLQRNEAMINLTQGTSPKVFEEMQKMLSGYSALIESGTQLPVIGSTISKQLPLLSSTIKEQEAAAAVAKAMNADLKLGSTVSTLLKTFRFAELAGISKEKK